MSAIADNQVLTIVDNDQQLLTVSPGPVSTASNNPISRSIGKGLRVSGCSHVTVGNFSCNALQFSGNGFGVHSNRPGGRGWPTRPGVDHGPEPLSLCKRPGARSTALNTSPSSPAKGGEAEGSLPLEMQGSGGEQP